MWSYIAYGLGIRSALALPELWAVGGGEDVTIRLGDVALRPSEVSEEGCVRATSKEVCIRFSQAGAFLIREGTEIVVDPVPNAEEQTLRLVILGPVMGALLYQRGWLPLHASSVAISGEVVAFVGERGWGKSTMAATMYARGHRLVSDDITAVKLGQEGHPTVYPGYSQLKLWPETAAVLGDNPESLPRLHSFSSKRGRRAKKGFSPAPLPLRRIYVLAEGEVPKVQPLASQEALINLVHHTYGRRLLQLVRTSSHFLQCANVAKTVPVLRLERPYALESLPDLVQLVEEDFARSA